MIPVSPSCELLLSMIRYPGSQQISYHTAENLLTISSSAQRSLFYKIFAYITAHNSPAFMCCASC